MSGSKGKNLAYNVEQLRHSVSELSVDDDADGWEVKGSRKSKSIAKPKPNPKPGVPPTSKPSSFYGPASTKPSSSGPLPRPSLGPPLQNGWNRDSHHPLRNHHPVKEEESDDDADDEDNAAMNDDSGSDIELYSDEFESDSSEKSHKSHETLKRSNWFCKFFKIMDELKQEEVNDVERQWHCPACQNGPGAIDWFTGLQPLISHAKTKSGHRLKPHRKFALLLEEELVRRGTSVVPPGETFGLWEGVDAQEQDHEIVWPPMVVIMNTLSSKDDNDKWIGMGNPELIGLFSAYTPAKARHAYGPQGHRGMSLLIFEASARGYNEAERLHKSFIAKGTGRTSWLNRPTLFKGGVRQLYGYLAIKKDLISFNQHSNGKSKLKFEMKSYHEMVSKKLSKMTEDNQQLSYYKDELQKEKKHSKTVEESLVKVAQNLKQSREENRVVREYSKLQHEENRLEMYDQEEFFRNQMKKIQENRDAKEESFKRLQLEEREKVKKSSGSSAESSRQRSKETSKLMECQVKDMKDYEAEKYILETAHKEKVEEMTKLYWENMVNHEAEFDLQLTALKNKFKPKTQPSN